jgi:hypothetical protein
LESAGINNSTGMGQEAQFGVEGADGELMFLCMRTGWIGVYGFFEDGVGNEEFFLQFYINKYLMGPHNTFLISEYNNTEHINKLN